MPTAASNAGNQRQTEQPPPNADSQVRLATMVEAIIFSFDRPVSASKIAEGVRTDGKEEAAIDQDAVASAVASLNEQYESSGRAFRIEQVAGGYRVMTLAEYAGVVGAFQKQRDSSKLSKPALETLAIIAYRQPITRADLESIRGVSCGEVLRSLLEKRLIAITGRAEVLGRPMLYGTTRAFLDAFGLSSIKDLPAGAEGGLSPGGGAASP